MSEVRVSYNYQIIKKDGEVEDISGYSKLEVFLKMISDDSRLGAIKNIQYSVEYVN